MKLHHTLNYGKRLIVNKEIVALSNFENNLGGYKQHSRRSIKEIVQNAKHGGKKKQEAI